MLTTISRLLFAAALLSFANGENTSNETADAALAHCNLVSVSHVDVHENGNGTVNIDMSWDRKTESYDAMGAGPIRMYVVRHGPMLNGRLVNTSEIIEIPYPEKDEFTLENIKPYDSYGVQICAVTTSFKILFQNDLWDKSWTGSMDLSSYRLPGESAPTVSTPGSPSTGAKSYKPECDLVQTSYVDIDEDNIGLNHTLTVRFSWDKKQTSYQSAGPVDGYTIRYGPLSSWGADIGESTARYLRVGNESESFVLHYVPRGGYYGLQICAVSKNTVGTYIDWQKDAWLGAMDFTSYDTSTGEDENTDLENTPENVTSFTARCDLVQNSHVAVDDHDPDSLTVNFAWDEKPASYANMPGRVSAYRVRYGRQLEWGSGIEETEAKYLDLENDTESFTLTNVPRGGYYGVQICAIVEGEDGGDDEEGVDWRNQAWLGSMDFTSYAPIGPAKSEKTPAEEDVGAKKVDQHIGTLVSRPALGMDYTIMLAVFTALTVIFILLACFWLAMIRKRQNAKIAALNSIEPTMYP